MNKRETLLARSERVIGKSLDNDTNSRPKRSLSRRREQVLQAQRTHRHRTQNYIRELEKEVFHLREENESMFGRIQKMQTQRQVLQDTLLNNGILVDIELETDDLAARGSVAGEDPERGNLLPPVVQINLTELADVVPQGSCENHPAEIAPPEYRTPSPASGHAESLPMAPLAIQAAIDFILTLEQPCLAHVKHAHMGYSTGTTPKGMDYNSGPGHPLTTSANIVHRYHRLDPAKDVMNLPKSDLERLLQASTRLQLDNEMTPVQIWARCQAMLISSNLVNEDLRKLTNECSKYVYCNSFGAVVEKATVLAILADVFGSELSLQA